MQLINNGLSWFSENIYSVLLMRGDGAIIEFKVYVNNNLFQFNLSSLITDPVVDIRSILKAQIQPLNYTNQLQNFTEIRIVARNANTKETVKWRAEVIPGGYNRSKYKKFTEEAFLRNCFLTWRKEAVTTFKGIKQQLTYANIATLSSPIKRDIYVKIYFKVRLPLEYKLTSSSFTRNSLYKIDCSLNIIEDLALSHKITDEVVAYDVYGITEYGGRIYENAPQAQRFVVGRTNMRHTHFFFQNSLGGFDTLTASGATKKSLQGKVSTVLINETEIETNNNTETVFEVNTGYIDNSRDISLWNEFLQSINKYSIHTDGTLHKIVVDEYEAEFEDFSICNCTFTYRLSVKDRTTYFQKQDLPEYNYDKTEL